MSAVRAIHSYRSRIDTTARLHVNLVAVECAWSSAGVSLHEVLRRLAKGGVSNLEVLNLQGNALGGTITSDIEIFNKLKTLNLSGMGVDGKIVEPIILAFVCLLTFHFCAGELPKELGNLVNLTNLLLDRNQFRGELYVPTYMRCRFADIVTFWQGNCLRSSEISST